MSRSFKGSYRSLPTQGKARPLTITYANGRTKTVKASTVTRQKLKARTRYERYLKSKEWRLLRKRVLRRDGHKCTTCGGASRLQVHHKTYKRIFEERLADLVTLCKACHLTEHQWAIRRGASFENQLDRELAAEIDEELTDPDLDAGLDMALALDEEGGTR